MSIAKFVEDQINAIGFDENNVPHPSTGKSVSSTSEDENGEDEDEGSVVEGDDEENQHNDEDNRQQDEVPTNVIVAMSVVEGGDADDEDTDTENEVVCEKDKVADKVDGCEDDDVLSKSVEEVVEAATEIGLQDVVGAEEITVEPVSVGDEAKNRDKFVMFDEERKKYNFAKFPKSKVDGIIFLMEFACEHKSALGHHPELRHGLRHDLLEDHYKWSEMKEIYQSAIPNVVQYLNNESARRTSSATRSVGTSKDDVSGCMPENTTNAKTNVSTNVKINF